MRILLSTTLLAGVLSLAAWAAGRRSPQAANRLWRVTLLSLTVFPGALVFSDISHVTMGVLPRYDAAALCQQYGLPGVVGVRPVDRLHLSAGTSAYGYERPSTAYAERPVSEWWQGNLTAFVWWLGVGAILASWILRDLWWIRWFAIRGSRPAPAAVRAEVERLAREMGITRPPRVVLAARLPIPVVVGLGRRTLALPEGFDADEPGARAVLAHELAHVGRADTFWGFVGRLARSAWWWHPLAQIAARGQRHTAEVTCDDQAVAAVGDPAGLAAQLVAGAERCSGLAVSIVGDDASHLRRRVDRLLRSAPKARREVRSTALMATAAVAFGLLGYMRLGKDEAHSTLPAYPVSGVCRLTAYVSGHGAEGRGARGVGVLGFEARRLAILLVPSEFVPTGLVEASTSSGGTEYGRRVDRDRALQSMMGEPVRWGYRWRSDSAISLDNLLRGHQPYYFGRTVPGGYVEAIGLAGCGAGAGDATGATARFEAEEDAIRSFHARVAAMHARGDVSRLAGVLRCFGLTGSGESAALLRFFAEVRPEDLRVEAMPGRAVAREDGTTETVLDQTELRARLADMERWVEGEWPAAAP